MDKEVFRIANDIGIEKLQIQLALQSAPLLTGVKISNLIIVDNQYVDAVMKVFEMTEISVSILSSMEEKTTILLYRKNELISYLKQQKVKMFLFSIGYIKIKLEVILKDISNNYKKYLENKTCFPHELGVLLGYPVEDVLGFMQNKGKNFLYTGYWKVYYDLSNKLKVFESFQQAEIAVMRMISKGNTILDIVNFYSATQNKEEKTSLYPLICCGIFNDNIQKQKEDSIYQSAGGK